MEPGQGQDSRELAALARVRDAGLEVYPAVTQALGAAEASDRRFDPDVVTAMARLAVGAWAMACDGGQGFLATLGDPQPLGFLLHPPFKSWEVAPGPVVRKLTIWGFDAGADPAEVDLQFAFTGRRRFADPADADAGADAAKAAASAAGARAELDFVGMITLALAEGDGRPWRILRGSVDTLDHYLGWAYTSRAETSEEFRDRTGAAGGAVRGQGPLRTYRLTSGFAEHNEKVGLSATADVRLAAPPDRYEAERLIQPAIRAATVERLGEGDWWPSMNWLDAVELLEPPEPLQEAGQGD